MQTSNISQVGLALAIAGGQLENALLERRRAADRLATAQRAFDSANSNVDHWQHQVDNLRSITAPVLHT